MRVVRYTAMRSAARAIVALMLTTVLLGAGLSVLRSLRHVDPRGRASWAGTAPAFDATPRDVTLFLPACDTRAIVLHPASATSGRVHAEFFIADPGGTARRAGATTVQAVPGASIALPLGDLRPPWRAPLVVRLSHTDGVLTLAPQRPFSLDLSPATGLGSLGCAFDGGAALPGALLLGSLLVVVAFSIQLGVSWLAIAIGTPARWWGRRETPYVAMLAAGATVVTYLLVVPPFEPPDELAHLQYARFVATTGTLPRAVPPHDSEWRASSYEFVQQPLYYLGAAAVLRTASLAVPAPALVPNPRSRLQPGGTEPTIFHHGAPPVPPTGQRALLVLRIASLLMALLTTWLIARLLTTVTADPLVIGTVAGGLGLIPQWCAVMSSVSTDPPATLLAAAATLAIVRVASGRRDTPWLLLTGLLVGAAYAVKATAAFLVPMAGLACFLAATIPPPRHERARHRSGELRPFLLSALRAALVIGLGIALAASWIPLRAWLVFGDPSAHDFKRAVLEVGGFVPTRGPMPWTAAFWAQMRVMVFEPFWARFGSLGAGPFPGSRVWQPYAAASVLLVALAFTGAIGTSLAALRRIRLGPTPSSPVDVFAAAVCGVGVCLGLGGWIGVNLVPQADMVVHWTPRHILPLTAPAALLVGAGLERLRHATVPIQRGSAVVVGVTIAALGLAWLGVFRATILMFHFGY